MRIGQRENGGKQDGKDLQKIIRGRYASAGGKVKKFV